MSLKLNDDGTGNSEKDWEIFDVLCQSNETKVRVNNHLIFICLKICLQISTEVSTKK
jgi:hypothetical protein